MARPEKVAVVDEIREKLAGADAAVLTEYRGLTVAELAELRGALRPAGAEYKIFKNTLARRAAEEAGLADLVPMLEGPTPSPSSSGDAVTAAKALRDFARDPRSPRREGRPARHPDADRRATSRRSPTSRPARCCSPARRRLPGAARQGRRPVPGVHPQLRLRPQGARRPAGRRRRGPRGPRRARARAEPPSRRRPPPRRRPPTPKPRPPKPRPRKRPSRGTRDRDRPKHAATETAPTEGE